MLDSDDACPDNAGPANVDPKKNGCPTTYIEGTTIRILEQVRFNSRDRARSVVTWLVAHGITPTRLRSEGYGITRPIDSNETDEGRRLNRRVEFHIADQPKR